MTGSRFVYYGAMVLTSAILASCSGQSSAPQPFEHLTGRQQATTANSAVRLPRGGVFSGSYAGDDSLVGCTKNKYGSFNFSGSGSAKFLNRGVETGSMQGHPILKGCLFIGGAMLRSRGHPGNWVTFRLIGPPCHSVNYGVVSGAGKFVHATGSGTVTFTCIGSSQYTDAWSGTLTF